MSLVVFASIVFSAASEPRVALVRTLASAQSDVCASVDAIGSELVLAGCTTTPAGADDAFVERVTADGDVGWRREIAGGGDAALWCVRALADGGVIAAGWTKSPRGDRDALVVRLAADGTVVWQRAFGDEHDERLWSLDLARDGVLAAGESVANGRSTALVLRATLDGGETWRRTPSSAENERVFAVSALADGAYVLGGMAGAGPRESADYDARVACHAPDGTLRWARTLGGADFDVAHDLRVTADGRVAVLGYSFTSADRAADPFLALLTSAGEVAWSRSVPGDDDERAVGLELLADGGFASAGYARAKGGDVDMLVRTFDASGAPAWCGRFGSSGDELGRALAHTRGGALVAAGHARGSGPHGQVLLVRFDLRGA